MRGGADRAEQARAPRCDVLVCSRDLLPLEALSRRSILHRASASVGMRAIVGISRRPHAASDRLLLLASVSLGLYRAQIVSGGRQCPRSQSESQAGGACGSVFGNRWVAVAEASSGETALSHG